MNRDLHQHLAQLALRVASAPPNLTAGMWYADDYIAHATAQGHAVGPRTVLPGAVPGGYFERLPRHGMYALRLKVGHSARAALQAFLGGPTITDCGTWVQALMYQALLRVLGAARFEEHFGGSAANRLTLVATGGTPLDPYLRHWDPGAQRPIAVGDAVYFAGVPGYAIKHPLGVAQGWHVICCGTQDGTPLFVGLGMSTPHTAAQVAERLVDEYNAPRTWAEKAVAMCRPLKHSMARHRIPQQVDRCSLGTSFPDVQLHRSFG